MRSFGFLAAAILIAGCGGGSSVSNADMSTSGGNKVCKTDGKDAALTGRYAVRASLNVNVKVTPGCTGNACLVDADSEAQLLFVADVTQTGTSATMVATPCAITIPKIALKGQNMPVELTVGDDLIASVKPVSTTGTLDGSKTCANFSLQPINLLFGAHLANPTTDALPGFTSGATPPVVLCGGSAATKCDPAPSDSGCVCDQEGDGNAGATLGVMNLPVNGVDKVLVDLRASVTLSGQVFPGAASAAQSIQGAVSALTLEQKILGCKQNGADCDATTTGLAAGLNPAISQSVNDASTFEAVPVSGTFSCSDVKSQQATLFN